MGNIYSTTQSEVNCHWVDRLNILGKEFSKIGVRLCLLGPGNTENLDPRWVSWLGAVDEPGTWDYLYYADIGIALAQGPSQHNESSKLYYYLRSGLPVVSEDGIPNNNLIDESGLGMVVPYDDPEAMVKSALVALQTNWETRRAIDYMKAHHLWEHRAEVYQQLINQDGRSTRVSPVRDGTN